MFNHGDRFPTGPALPKAARTARPWGLRRLRPYDLVEVFPYAKVELDPETQTARYLDETGQPVAMPKHGTSTGTTPPTATGGGDGKNPGSDQDRGSDSDQ